MNKKFLGLGFTFTAQDRGLGKRLAEYSSALQSISESLDSIEAHKGVGGGRPSSGASTASSPGASVTRRSPNVVTPEPAQKTPEKAIDPSLKTSQFFQKLKKEVGPEIFGKLQTDLDPSSVKTDKNGDLTLDSKKKILEMVDEMVRAKKEMKVFSLTLQSVKYGFKTVGEYLRGVGRSFENLLQTFGLNLREMIPPQLSAALQLVKSIVAGPLKLLMGIGKDALMKKQVSLTEKFKDDLNEQIGPKTGPSIKDLLSKIANTGASDDKKQGAFSGFFSSIAGKLIDGFGVLKTFIPALLSRFLGPALTAGIETIFSSKIGTKIWGSIGSRIVAMITNPLGLLRVFMTPLAGVLGEIVLIGAALAAGYLVFEGWLSGLSNLKTALLFLGQNVMEFGSALLSAGKLIGLKLLDLLPEPIKEAVISASRAMVSVFGTVLEGIKAGFKYIVDSTIQAFSDTVDAFSSVFGKIGKFFFSAPDSLRSIGATISQVESGAAVGLGQKLGSVAQSIQSWADQGLKDRSEKLRQSTDDISGRKAGDQADVQRTNDLLEQMLKKMPSEDRRTKVDVTVRSPDLGGRLELMSANTVGAML